MLIRLNELRKIVSSEISLLEDNNPIKTKKPMQPAKSPGKEKTEIKGTLDVSSIVQKLGLNIDAKAVERSYMSVKAGSGSSRDFENLANLFVKFVAADQQVKNDVINIMKKVSGVSDKINKKQKP